MQELYKLFCPPGIVSAQCQAATLVYREESGTIEYKTWAIAATTVGGFFFLLFLVVAVRSRTARRGYESV